MKNDYELYEIHKGHFVKLIDGKVVSKASDEEVTAYFFKKTISDVDPGIIEVTLALSALFAVIVVQRIEVIIQAVAALCFIMSYGASMMLYGTYVLHRIPNTLIKFLEYRNKNKQTISDLWVWLITYYPFLIFKAMFRDKGMSWDQKNTEVGYLTLLGALAIGGGAVSIYLASVVLISLFSKY